MRASFSSAWAPGPGGGPAGEGGSGLRLSDAERTEVADRLAKHYEDGRLDQAEFNERVDQVMRAKTRADLAGVFADLPPLEMPAACAPQAPSAGLRQRHGRRHPVLLVVLAVVLAVIVAHAVRSFLVPWFFVPWAWIAILAVIVVYASRKMRRSP